MTNLQEYLSGTDPHDAASYLKIDQLTALPGQRLLSFLAISNHSYTVVYQDTPDAGAWLKLVDIPARSTNRMEVVADSAPAIGSRFYRLVTPAQ